MSKKISAALVFLMMVFNTYPATAIDGTLLESEKKGIVRLKVMDRYTDKIPVVISVMVVDGDNVTNMEDAFICGKTGIFHGDNIDGEDVDVCRLSTDLENFSGSVKIVLVAVGHHGGVKTEMQDDIKVKKEDLLSGKCKLDVEIGPAFKAYHLDVSISDNFQCV